MFDFSMLALGFVLGVVATIFMMVILENSLRKRMIKAQKRRQEREDPANWWKYGNEPPQWNENIEYP
jgi:hypothetical protein